MKYFISIAIFMFISSFAGVRAQNDPTLAGMILMYTNKAEKELKNQEKVMLLQSTGHIWTKEEVEALPTCSGSSTTIWTPSVPSSAMPHRYMVSITR